MTLEQACAILKGAKGIDPGAQLYGDDVQGVTNYAIVPTGSSAPTGYTQQSCPAG